MLLPCLLPLVHDVAQAFNGGPGLTGLLRVLYLQDGHPHNGAAVIVNLFVRLWVFTANEYPQRAVALDARLAHEGAHLLLVAVKQC